MTNRVRSDRDIALDALAERDRLADALEAVLRAAEAERNDALSDLTEKGEQIAEAASNALDQMRRELERVKEALQEARAWAEEIQQAPGDGKVCAGHIIALADAVLEKPRSIRSMIEGRE